MQGVVIGRIVHYVVNEEVQRAALITDVENETGVVTLLIFPSHAQDKKWAKEKMIIEKTSVSHDQGEAVGTWHFIGHSL